MDIHREWRARGGDKNKFTLYSICFMSGKASAPGSIKCLTGFQICFEILFAGPDGSKSHLGHRHVTWSGEDVVNIRVPSNPQIQPWRFDSVVTKLRVDKLRCYQ